MNIDEYEGKIVAQYSILFKVLNMLADNARMHKEKNQNVPCINIEISFPKINNISFCEQRNPISFLMHIRQNQFEYVMSMQLWSWRASFWSIFCDVRFALMWFYFSFWESACMHLLRCLNKSSPISRVCNILLCWNSKPWKCYAECVLLLLWYRRRRRLSAAPSQTHKHYLLFAAASVRWIQ